MWVHRDKHVDAEDTGAQHAPPRTGVRSRVSSEQLVSNMMAGVQEGQVRGKVLSQKRGTGRVGTVRDTMVACSRHMDGRVRVVQWASHKHKGNKSKVLPKAQRGSLLMR
jgi:hypothetical protein